MAPKIGDWPAGCTALARSPYTTGNLEPEADVLYVVLGVLLGVILVVVLLGLSATTPSERVRIPRDLPRPGDPEFLDLVALSSDVRFYADNRVELLVDGGRTFRRLFEDIRSATRSITLQLYFCQPGDMADQLGEALMERARAGVRVLFLHDAFGSDLPDSYFEPLREAGVNARTFRPLRWWTLHKAQERSHARIVVIDGEIGYTGGFGIDDRWSAHGTEEEAGWRDTNVRFTGPAVASLQAAFAGSWAESAGEVLVDRAFYPGLQDSSAGHAVTDAQRREPALAGVIYSRPALGSSTAERLLALTIVAARETLYIANAYFVPGTEYREMLAAAARRGVDVRVLAPSDNSDIPIVRYAGRALFPELMAAGVRIYEYTPAMMHAKTMVADGVWSMIGTINFDNRSLALNEESSLLVQDAEVGARVQEVFLNDLEQAVEITPESFARRPLHERVKERIATAGSRLL
jgi:cardiolipin synthase A/B